MKLQKVGGIHQGRPITVGLLRERVDAGVHFHDAFPLVDSINAEMHSGLRVISPEVADTLVHAEGPALAVRNGSPFFTNAAVAYEAEGKPLGAHVILSLEGQEEGQLLYVLATGRYRGEKGIALFVPNLTGADFKRMDDCLVRIDVPDSRLVVVPYFPPGGSRHFFAHGPTTLPFHTPVDRTHPDARYLIRREGPFVGPVVRCVGQSGVTEASRHVSLDFGPSATLGVLVEIPEKDSGKFD